MDSKESPCCNILCIVYSSLTFNSSQTTHVDGRDRRDRMEIQTNSWGIQISNLVNAYLEFLSGSDNMGCTPTPSPPLADGASASSFTIKVLDMFCK